jgi:predicted esterase
VCAAGTLLLVTSCNRIASEASPEEPGETTQRMLVFTLDSGDSFDAVLDRPAPGRDTGWGVLMIGGGLGNTLDWETPGSVTHEGRTIALTISGEPHADAPPISRALTERGLSVLRWSTIARGDPLADEWPARATPRTQQELIDQARAALRALRDSIGGGRIILLGHSQGASRAITLVQAEPGVGSLVLLAPAYFTRDERVARTVEANGLRFADEVLREHPLPTLALFGGKDPSRAVNPDAACILAGSAGFESLHAEVFPSLGHQLGPFEDSRHGPIDRGVVGRIADWCGGLAREP